MARQKRSLWPPTPCPLKVPCVLLLSHAPPQFHIKNKFKEIDGLAKDAAGEALEDLKAQLDELKAENGRLAEECGSLQEQAQQYLTLKPQYDALFAEFQQFKEDAAIEKGQMELQLMKLKAGGGDSPLLVQTLCTHCPESTLYLRNGKNFRGLIAGPSPQLDSV